jgi:hypothetical protein
MIGPKQTLNLLLLVCSLAVSVVNSFTSSSSFSNIKSLHHRSSTAMMMSSKKEDITMIELPPSETLDKLLTVAIDASKQAGDIILGNAGGADVLKSKANSRDLLTLIDPLCEKVRRLFLALLL